MQHPLQTYKIDIFSESGKDYITWSQYNLNNVCSQPHVNFHDDRTHKPIVNDKNVNLACCLALGALQIG